MSSDTSSSNIIKHPDIRKVVMFKHGMSFYVLESLVKKIAELKEKLKASSGKDVRLDTKVDSSLLGGLVVKIGSRMIDSSLRTKLTNLKVVLKGAG